MCMMGMFILGEINFVRICKNMMCLFFKKRNCMIFHMFPNVSRDDDITYI